MFYSRLKNISGYLGPNKYEPYLMPMSRKSSLAVLNELDIPKTDSETLIPTTPYTPLASGRIISMKDRLNNVLIFVSRETEKY